jgi:hypothetical protein
MGLAVATEESSLAQEGREILTQQKLRHRAFVNGVRAQKGHWIVNSERKRVAGQVLYVKRSGVIVWRDNAGFEDFTIKSEPSVLERAGYELRVNCPDGSDWSFLSHGVYE